ncbi:hypothetical protein HG444_001015 [Candidatus Saccharibacteria bacterium]|jgi:hypothetical protein|nr:hypothetical protein [Candidatus Saccharibacteria bacterium]
MSNSVTSLNNPTRLADSSKLTIQVTALWYDDAGELDAVEWTSSADQAATFSDADHETNKDIAQQVLQHFGEIPTEEIDDMVLVRVSGRTAEQVSAVAFVMIRLRNSSIWMVSNTEAGSVILAEMPDLYDDIRNEMITEKVAEKTDRFMQKPW